METWSSWREADVDANCKHESLLESDRSSLAHNWLAFFTDSELVLAINIMLLLDIGIFLMAVID